jgi:putative peptidoglycan lipid II flippase
LFYAYFATRLPEGSFVYLSQADRLNQLPLALVGSAIGTAILPAISRHIGQGEDAQAANIQGRATELAMLLTIPATIALMVAAGPIMTVLFEGGKFTAADAATSALVLSVLVAGLPAYVMIKVLAPGFYARKDMKTPVYITLATLAASVVANFLLIDEYGIVVLPFTTAAAAWVNAILLYALLAARGQFKVEGWLASRLVRQFIAALAMGATIWLVGGMLDGYFAGSVGKRLIGTVALIGAGGIVYFALAWITGGMDKEDVLVLLRKKKVEG